MKALTLWEPYASLVRAGAKRIETRDWAPSYRGPLLIHAAAVWGREQKKALADLQTTPEFQRAFPNGFSPHLGMFVARVDLMECWEVRSLVAPREVEPEILVDVRSSDCTFSQLRVRRSEFSFGDIRPGRWLWMTENVKRTALVPARGHQQLWDAPDDVPVLEE